MMLDIKKTEHLYKNSYLSYLGSAFGAILVFLLFKPVAPVKVLTIWFVIFIVLTVLRFIVSIAFQRIEHNDDIDIWLIAFLALSFVSGTLWGLTGFLFIPENSLPLMQSVLYHGMLLLFIAVLVTGSVITYSISQLVFLSFAIPAILPQSLMLVAKGDVYHSFLGGFMLAYAIVIFVISIYMSRMLSSACAVEAENDMLRQALKEADIDIDDIKN